MGIVGHLNLSPGNLGGNLKSLEKRGLTGITSGRSLRDDNIRGCNSSYTSRGRTYVGLKRLTYISKVSIGENETNVSAAKIPKLSNGGSLVCLAVLADALSHHGVLSHENLSLPTESPTGKLELVGTNIVDSYNEAL